MNDIFICNVLIVVFTIIGNILCIYKHRLNYSIGGLWIIPSAYIAIYYHNWGSLFASVLATAFCIWGWIEWGKDENKRKTTKEI